MTNAEAMKELKILKDEYWDDDGYGHETKKYDDVMIALDMAIKALKQEPRWIPVSERLPEPNIAVLTYVDTGASETFCLAYWNDACGGWEEWIGTRMIETEMEYKVLAWMPLPEPYQGESEGK